MSEASVRGFSVGTKCRTVEEFVERFHDRADDKSIFVHLVETRVIGTECGFAILLADMKPVLAGICVVLDVFHDANNRFKRPGMRLGIKRLGPDSERVFAELAAARRRAALPDPRGTPVVAPAATITATRTGTAAAAVAVPRRATEPMRYIAEAEVEPRVPARAASPPGQAAARELTRVPRATTPIGPAHAQSNAPVYVMAEGSKNNAARLETRAPGSRFVLPANPLMDLTDASLEGLVEAGLVDSARAVVGHAPGAPAPPTTPIAQRAPPAVPPIAPPPVAAAPLPRPTQVAPVEHAAVEVRAPWRTRGLRTPLLVTAAVVLVAAAIAGWLQRGSSPTTPIAPGASLRAEPAGATLAIRTTARVEPPPPARTAAATKRTPRLHAVLVKTVPIAAKVVVNGRSFGTTPTYVKVPAFTPVELQIARPGFEPVTYKLTSKTRTDRVLIKLERKARRRP